MFALALSLVLAGAGVAYMSRQSPEQPEQPLEIPALAPVSDVWPEALLTMPHKLKNGRSVIPLAMLDTDTALVMTTDRHRPAFLSLDVHTGRQDVLATAPKRASCTGCFDIRLSPMTINATHVIFLVKRYQPEGEPHMELWSMPRAGGSMKMVTRLPTTEQGDVGGFEIVGDFVAWWNLVDIWRGPLTGGEPEQILPERNLRVTSWPWAYDRQRQGIVNLVTGQESKAQHEDDIEYLDCGSVWCVGQVATQPHEAAKAALQRVNGSGRTTIPGDPLTLVPPIRDRLVILRPPAAPDSGTRWGGGYLGPSAQLYDRCTQRAALLGFPERTKAPEDWNKIRFGAATPDGPIMFWKTTRGRYTVLDLSRITDPPCI
ncbi:hypothetical protein [Streptosporangium sp. NBC_01469]|uniref:hypothetical protein n=1 Tax=Streptosporangium sp. NBC_01469 TaxID=2903898 RepID=UPI002E2D9B4F|nr:hypothetical protein [Streptosporangium sp. NBC_01469]